MPLIIHPSSSCDVCWEPLACEGRPPYTIPCGHAFCRGCLHSLNPTICPLCRKPYLRAQSKKLITGEGESNVPAMLLKRLLLSWDASGAGGEAVAAVEKWLSAGNKNQPLSKAHDLIQAYEKLKLENDSNQRSNGELQRRLEAREANEIKENAKATRQRLFSKFNTKVSERYEAEFTPQKVSNPAMRKNPLPQQPDPHTFAKLGRRGRAAYVRSMRESNGGVPSSSSTSRPPATEDTMAFSPTVAGTLYPRSLCANQKGKARAAPTLSMRKSYGGPSTPFPSSTSKPPATEDTDTTQGSSFSRVSPQATGSRFITSDLGITSNSQAPESPLATRRRLLVVAAKAQTRLREKRKLSESAEFLAALQHDWDSDIEWGC